MLIKIGRETFKQLSVHLNRKEHRALTVQTRALTETWVEGVN